MKFVICQINVSSHLFNNKNEKCDWLFSSDVVYGKVRCGSHLHVKNIGNFS